MVGMVNLVVDLFVDLVAALVYTGPAGVTLMIDT